MESIFTTNISIGNKSASYHVYFDHEKYIFMPEPPEEGLPTFSIKREHDEWHDQDPIDPDLKDQAVEALEGYLLKQH
ncbi:hypothetical protein OCK74_16210 [Chitinophagaceae bacterium LB-8]|uniref:Uncharacterized protein n=1 Tax=Paraflavisolibacter caeni TaxID=2982496 RepID=A0A9X2XPE3_9BACT|nr:hypothetical protein [Paraflavisolibacter caeni]MCU7550664.1 hypothetical protein [Paraflavisolibacter caeni]